MNILFINNIPFNPRLGGIERVTDILTKALIDKGYNIYYLCGYVSNNKFLEYNFPVKMHTLPEEGLFNSEKNKEYLNHLINKYNINIIVNQRGLEPLFNPVLENPRIKKISVLHSKPEAYLGYYLHIYNHNNNATEILKNIIKTIIYPLFYYIKKNKALSKISEQLNHIYKKSNAIVLLSPRYKEDFQNHLISQYRIKTPIYGIPNPNTYPIQNISWKEKEKIILFVGRLESIDKNPIRLLKIWKRIHKKHLDWKLLIVGDGSLKETLKLYILKNKISRVYFEGNQTDVSKYYKKASFICLTSNYEGWPMVLTEGMSFGCIPLTFTSFKAAYDIIDNNINGYLIRPFNIIEYAKKLEQTMNDKEKCKKMSQAAIIKASNFEIQTIIKKWMNLFETIIK